MLTTDLHMVNEWIIRSLDVYITFSQESCLFVEAPVADAVQVLGDRVPEHAQVHPVRLWRQKLLKSLYKGVQRTGKVVLFFTRSTSTSKSNAKSKYI